MTKLHDLTVVMTHLQQLFPDAPAESVEGLSQEEIFQAFSRLMTSQKVAVLHMEYPEIGDLDHRDLNALMLDLNHHGMPETALLVAQNAPFIITENLNEADRTLREIQRHLQAVEVILYYRGQSGADAESALREDMKEAASAA